MHSALSYLPGEILYNTGLFTCKQSKFFRSWCEQDMNELPQQWCLYCIYDKTAGAVKVGASTRPLDRLDALQTGNPNPMYLGIVHPLRNSDGTFLSGLAAKRLERDLHDKLAHLRMAGGTEWFRACDEQRRIVEQHWDLKSQLCSIVWHWA